MSRSASPAGDLTKCRCECFADAVVFVRCKHDDLVNVFVTAQRRDRFERGHAHGRLFIVQVRQHQWQVGCVADCRDRLDALHARCGFLHLSLRNRNRLLPGQQPASVGPLPQRERGCDHHHQAEKQGQPQQERHAFAMHFHETLQHMKPKTFQ